jgi:hypothetical protein
MSSVVSSDGIVSIVGVVGIFSIVGVVGIFGVVGIVCDGEDQAKAQRYNEV